MPGKIRFGMVGTGFIADWVLAGARQDARFEAVAICSRTQEPSIGNIVYRCVRHLA